MPVRRIRYIIFLRDVLVLTLSAIGGPNAHMATMLKKLVYQKRYISEEELLELNALSQILPGPAATQIITAVGFKFGGPTLAYLTLLVWIFPAVALMTAAAIFAQYIPQNFNFTEFITPMAVGMVAYASYNIASKAVTTNTGIILMTLSAITSYFFRSPWVLPVLIIIGGAATSIKFQQQQKEFKRPMKIDWSNFILFLGVYIGAAILGALTGSLIIKLFQNFYRSGALIFGGGQVLIPLFYSEFVELKHYLTESEFLTGYAMSQAVPGPVFSFASYIGALSMRDYGTWGQIAGGAVTAAGIFLPGTFLIFFIIRFWDQLKKFRLVKASLEGIQAASSGLVISATLILFDGMQGSILNVCIMIGTFLVMTFTKIPASLLILTGLILGFVF